MAVTSAAERRAVAQLRRQAADATRHERGDIAYQAFRSAPPLGVARRGPKFSGELRAKTETRNGKELVHTWGYFTRYARYYPMWDAFGGYKEQVCRGSGAQTLASRPEVAFLTNHAGMAMARTTAGTLELREDDQGGWHDGWLNPKRSDVSDLVIAINDGDVPQMSFAFTIPEGGGWWSEDFESFDITQYDMEGGDVSAVNFGANPFTDISARVSEVLDDIERLPAGALEEASARLVLRGAPRERIQVRGRPERHEQRGPLPKPGAYPERLAGRLERTLDRYAAAYGQAPLGVDELRSERLDWYEIRNADGREAEPGDVPEEEGVASVFIFDEIGGSMGVSAKKFAADLEVITAPRIKVRINSPGGSVFDGVAIHSALLHHPSSVRTYIDGIAASAASFIAMAASPPDGEWGGIRAMPGSQMMLHDASAMVEGNADDMGRMATFLARQSDNIADLYAAVAGGTREEWREIMLAETWAFAEEAREMGLVDVVEPHPRSLAVDPETEERMRRSFDLSRFGYRFTSRSAAPAPRQTRSAGPRWAGERRSAAAILDGRTRIDELIEASSLGTPDAVAMRERTSPEAARGVMQRAEELRATPDQPKGRSIASIENWLAQQKLDS